MLTEKDLIYAAFARCPCGAGLAYKPGTHPGYWDCADILLEREKKDVQHTDRLPFTFYEIKSERQPSANGETTRPQSQKDQKQKNRLVWWPIRINRRGMRFRFFLHGVVPIDRQSDGVCRYGWFVCVGPITLFVGKPLR